MQCGMVGLGRMGANMARRLLRGGHEVVVTNRSPEPVEQLTAEGASGARTVRELVERLQPPRAIWVSLPAGEVTEDTLTQLAPLLARGDVIVESGNSFYRDTIRRAESLAQNGIDLLDQGTSGGIWGLEIGYCLMIGGSHGAFQRLDELVAKMNTASGMEKMTATAAVVTEMVTQRRTMREGMMKMQEG